MALHFLARQRPRPAVLPTARFVPDFPARAPSRALRPTDLPLLLLRLAAVLAAGAALAGPVFTAARRPVARVILVDASRAARSSAEVRDSARALLAPGDVVVVFDAAARLLGGSPADSLRALGAREAERDHAPGSLSAALALAVRAAAGLRERADSLELVFVSPLAREEWDHATAAIRGLWRGRARLVRVAAAESVPPSRITMDGPADDPLRATLALAGRAALALTGRAAAASETRLLRGHPLARDSAWARETGGVLVVWPAEPAALWPGTRAADTVGALVRVTGGGDPQVIVASFPRAAALPPGRAVAYWVDGLPGAVERPLGAGCERDVAVPVSAQGDLALRAALRRLLASLAEPCGGRRDLTPLADSQLKLLGGGGALLAARRVGPSGRGAPPPASVWLLAVTAALLVIEMLVRSRGAPREPEAA